MLIPPPPRILTCGGLLGLFLALFLQTISFADIIERNFNDTRVATLGDNDVLFIISTSNNAHFTYSNYSGSGQAYFKIYYGSGNVDNWGHLYEAIPSSYTNQKVFIAGAVMGLVNSANSSATYGSDRIIVLTNQIPTSDGGTTEVKPGGILNFGSSTGLDRTYDNAFQIKGIGCIRAGWSQGHTYVTGKISDYTDEYGNKTAGTLWIKDRAELMNGENDYSGGTVVGMLLYGDSSVTNTVQVDGTPYGVGSLSFGVAGSSVNLNGHSITLGGLDGSNNFVGKINGSGTLTINTNINDYSTASTIEGSINLVKTGTKTQTLTGANTYTGTTTISEGTLKLSGSGTLGTGDVTNSGTLEFNNSTTSIPSDISGAGDILVSAGTATLTGAVIQTGGATTLADGTTLNIGNASTLYNLAVVDEDSSATLTVTGDLTLSNDDESTFIGSITAQKITVNTANDVALKLYAGANNKVTADSLTVSSGELDFKGYFAGNIEVFNGSVFSPGNSVGTADITGNITFAGATADSNGVALFEFGEYTGEDKDHDLFVMENGGIFTADDGVILLDFANHDENLWATEGNKYLLVSGGGFADGDDNYANWLASTPDYSDLFKLTGIDGSLYLVGLKAAPEPGSGVPEPSTWALLALGVIVLFLRKRK